MWIRSRYYYCQLKKWWQCKSSRCICRTRRRTCRTRLALFASPARSATRTTSSAYASAETNQLPIKHRTPAFFSSMSSVSRYTHNNIGLIIAPCFTPFETEKWHEKAPFHNIRPCCPVCMLSANNMRRNIPVHK